MQQQPTATKTKRMELCETLCTTNEQDSKDANNPGSHCSQALTVTAVKDAFMLRGSFFKMVEELKMRRLTDIENEKTINQLMTQNHEYEQELEEHNQKYSSLERLLQENEKMFQDQFDERLKQHQIDKSKLEIMLGAKEKKFKSLSNEIRTLQMNKHSLEKKLRELETSVFAQSDSHSICSKQLEQLEHRYQDMTTGTNLLLKQLDILQGNVLESVALNKKLSFVNDHQNCIIQKLKNELEMKTHQLIQTKSEMKVGVDISQVSVYCHDDQQQHTEIEMANTLRYKLDCLQKEHSNIIMCLKEAHEMIEKHVLSCNRSMEKENILKAKVDNLSMELEFSCTKLQQQDDKMRQICQKEMNRTEKLEKSILGLSQRLKALQDDYTMLQTSRDHLEAELSAAVLNQNSIVTEQKQEKSIEQKSQQELELEVTMAGSESDIFDSKKDVEKVNENDRRNSQTVPEQPNLTMIVPTLLTTTDTVRDPPPSCPKSITNQQTAAVTMNSNEISVEIENVSECSEKSPKRIKIADASSSSPTSIINESPIIVLNATQYLDKSATDGNIEPTSIVLSIEPETSSAIINNCTSINNTATEPVNTSLNTEPVSTSINTEPVSTSINTEPVSTSSNSIPSLIEGNNSMLVVQAININQVIQETNDNQTAMSIEGNTVTDLTSLPSDTQNVNINEIAIINQRLTLKLCSAQNDCHGNNNTEHDFDEPNDIEAILSQPGIICNTGVSNDDIGTPASLSIRDDIITPSKSPIGDIKLTFSDDDDGNELKDSQLSNQINRIELYLKKDRLKRTRHIT